ncbi:archaeal ATPase [Peptococcaceae bacterium CEB3]|nr:archaeal ATPase [Peptococcaceae bacterium CEB3]
MLNKPFPVGSPVPKDDLVDREEFVQNLEQRLTFGQHLMIAGPRRVGKTSLILNILENMKAKGFYIGFIDLFSIDDIRNFSNRFLNACLENRTGISKTIEALQTKTKKFYGDAKISFKISDLEMGLNFSGSKEIDLDYVLDFPEQLAVKDHKNVIIVFDEFQDMLRIGGEQIFKKLRSHFQMHKNVLYVFLGSQEHMMNTLFSHSEQAFYRFAIPLAIPPIPENAWTEYLARKFSGLKIQGSPALFAEIVRLSGGHPQDTMVFCSEIYFACLEHKITILSLDLIHYAYKNALMSLSSTYNAIIEEFGFTSVAYTVLLRIAQEKAIYTKEHNPNEYKRAINLLLMKGVVQKAGRGEYIFAEPMFREYILQW